MYRTSLIDKQIDPIDGYMYIYKYEYVHVCIKCTCTIICISQTLHRHNLSIIHINASMLLAHVCRH